MFVLIYSYIYILSLFPKINELFLKVIKPKAWEYFEFRCYFKSRNIYVYACLYG